MSQTVFNHALNEITTNLKPGMRVGMRRFEDGKEYVFERITDTLGSGLAAGDVLYRSLDNSAVDSDQSAAGSLVPAGVTVTAITTDDTDDNDQAYVWLQIRGYCTLNTTIAGTLADGKAITGGTTDKAFAMSAAATDAQMGVTMDASEKKVYLAIP